MKTIKKHKAKHLKKSIPLNKILILIIIVIIPVIFALNTPKEILSYFTSSSSITNIFKIAGAYSVEFNANGGDGTMQNQDFVYGTTQNLESNTFTKENGIFIKWNTKPDGSRTDYKNGQLVKNLTKEENGIVDLYAIWSAKSYFKDEFTFTGSNYIDTGVYLFEDGTINRDFEISFEITESANSQKDQATIVSAMDETASPWPGIVYRFKKGSSTIHQVGANVNTSIKNEKDIEDTINKVNIKRTNGIIYLKLNDGEYEEFLDMSSLDTTFFIPLTFGASLKGNGTRQREFTGTLANLSVEIF